MLDYDAIRSSVSMPDLLKREGIEVRKGWAICPFHVDHNPSMKVYDDGFYCFVCGAGGDIVNFYAKLHGLKNSEAARELSGGKSLTYSQSIEVLKKKKQKQKVHQLLLFLIDLRRQIAAQGVDVSALDEQIDWMERGLEQI